MATSDHAFTARSPLGASGDPTYSGALSFMRRRFSKDVEGTDLTVWGVPYDLAVSNRPGARFGAQAIRRASAIFDNDPQYPFRRDLFERFSVIDYGDCALDYRRPEDAHETIVREARSLLSKTAFLLTLGGDHSITHPLLEAHADRHGPLSLVQFDAHQDTWPAVPRGERGALHADHGSFVTTAVEAGLVVPSQSIQIGVRTHAPSDFGIEILYGNEVEEMSAKAIAEAIHRRTNGTNVYLTFDIDCLDPAFAPGTGTPVAGGPSSAKMLSVLHHLENLQLVGADVVEVSPPYDHADTTAIAGATVAMYIVGIMAGKAGERAQA